jgi:hypothetical protein
MNATKCSLATLYGIFPTANLVKCVIFAKFKILKIHGGTNLPPPVPLG